MFGNQPLQENGLPAYEAAASQPAPKDPVGRGIKQLFGRAVRQPGEIIALVREGKNSDASMRCMFVGALAFVFEAAWGMLVALFALVIFFRLSGYALDPSAVTDAMSTEGSMTNWFFNALVYVALVPILIAHLLVPVFSLVGSILGFISLLQAESNKLWGLLGLASNGVLVAVWTFLALGAVAMFLP